MKKLYILLFAATLLYTAPGAYAQGGFSALIKSGPADATKLVNAYGEPLFKGIGVGLNSGWYSSAKAKKILGFDLRISASATFVPTSDKTFDVSKIGLSSNVRLDDPSHPFAPTFGGSTSTQGPLLDIYDDNGQKVGSYTMPSGKLSVIPAPQVQLTIGLVYNTDLTVRGIPTIDMGSTGSVSSIGFGLRHDIMRDIVGKTADKLIPFDLAIAAGYSHLSMSIPMTVNPDEGAKPKDSQQSTDFSNQHIGAAFNNFMIEAIISKKITFFTPFLSVGYNSTHTALGVYGNFPITTGETITGTSTYTSYNNPINITESSINGLRADLGFELTPGFFRLYVSGSIAQYKSVNAGIGFGF